MIFRDRWDIKGHLRIFRDIEGQKVKKLILLFVPKVKDRTKRTEWNDSIKLIPFCFSILKNAYTKAPLRF
jgi:hypothetical protein